MKLTRRSTHRFMGRWKVWTVDEESEPIDFENPFKRETFAPTPEELALRQREVEANEAIASRLNEKFKPGLRVDVPTEVRP